MNKNTDIENPRCIFDSVYQQEKTKHQFIIYYLTQRRITRYLGGTSLLLASALRRRAVSPETALAFCTVCLLESVCI
jgi:hypothetical protein